MCSLLWHVVFVSVIMGVNSVDADDHIGQRRSLDRVEDSCYAGIDVSIPAPKDVKVVLVDNSTFFSQAFRRAILQKGAKWPQLGDRIVLLRIAGQGEADRPEVILDLAIEPRVEDSLGVVPLAREKKLDQCLQKQLATARKTFDDALDKTVQSYVKNDRGRTNLFSAINTAGGGMRSVPGSKARMWVLSDGLEHSGSPPLGTSFYEEKTPRVRRLDVEQELAQLRAKNLIPDLAGVRVWWSGLGLVEPSASGQSYYRTPGEISILTGMWNSYWRETKANVVELSPSPTLMPLE
jgi:hypothetical protein